MNYIFPRWFAPAPQYQNQQPWGYSVLRDTIVGIALSVFALIGANALDRDAPVLAALLRCVPAGMALIWLFRRCQCGQNGFGNHFNYHYQNAGYQQQYAPQQNLVPPPAQPYYNWFWRNPVMYPAPAFRAAPPPPPPPPIYQQRAPRFPPVMRAPAQPPHQPMHPAPAFRQQPLPHHAPPSFHPVPPPFRQHGAPHHHAAPHFPPVLKAPANRGGFPPVMRAPAQPMHAAPQSRGRGNEPPMFPAAKTRQ